MAQRRTTTRAALLRGGSHAVVRATAPQPRWTQCPTGTWPDPAGHARSLAFLDHAVGPCTLTAMRSLTGSRRRERIRPTRASGSSSSAAPRCSNGRLLRAWLGTQMLRASRAWPSSARDQTRCDPPPRMTRDARAGQPGWPERPTSLPAEGAGGGVGTGVHGFPPLVTRVVVIGGVSLCQAPEGASANARPVPGAGLGGGDGVGAPGRARDEGRGRPRRRRPSVGRWRIGSRSGRWGRGRR